jgi:Amidohydrolase family
MEPGARVRALADLDVDSVQARATLARLARHHVVVDPTMATEELGATPRAEISRVEPGLAKVPPELAPILSSIGATGDDIESAKRTWKASRETLRALHQAGVTIVAGTDQAVPGHSLHRELELYVEAGLSPMEAIQAATIVPARVMKRNKDLGTIEAGKVADLIFVDGDPLADIHALRKIVTVVAGGRCYETKTLWPLAGFKP